MTEADCKKYYKKVIRDLKNAYQRSWSRLLANVRPLDDLPIPINGRVKDKEQALLKERLTVRSQNVADVLSFSYILSVIELQYCTRECP